MEHSRLRGVNYDYPRPSSVISRTPSGVLEIFPLGSLYFCLSRHSMKSDERYNHPLYIAIDIA